MTVPVRLTATCAACRTLQPLAEMEPVPTRPHLLRCADEAACRERYAPRGDRPADTPDAAASPG